MKTKCVICDKCIKKGDKYVTYNLGDSRLSNPIIHFDCNYPQGKDNEIYPVLRKRNA